jgi:glucosamine-6-phosphate deaminase
MDEYLGCNEMALPGFGYFLRRSIFERLPFRTVNYLNGLVDDPASECKRYARLILDHPPDLVCLGIGENGHLAFNDPHIADFSDDQMVKMVTLDEASRKQQVHDGCFAELNQVPTQAITLTIPALMMGRFLYCLVPGKNKARAVRDTLYQPVEKKYPSTILRKHPACVLFLDPESATGIKKGNPARKSG